MPPQVLAIVVLPRETKLLDSDVAGRPAGRYLLDRLGSCEGIIVQVAAVGPLPAWCDAPRISAGLTDEDTGDRPRRHILIVDGRAWLSHAVLAQVLLRTRQAGTGFRVAVSGDGRSPVERQTTTLAVHLSPGQRHPEMLRTLRTAPVGIEQLLDSDAFAQAEVADAADLDRASPCLLIDSCSSLATVEQHVQFDRAMDALRRGVRLRDPSNVYIRGDVVFGADVEIEIGVLLEGTVVLGNGVKIGAHSIVRNAQIGENTCIHPFSLVEQSIVGANGFVGPYGRIRPGCAIGDGIQIGNYVEVKNSRIGAGSRINHHSFIGDAVLAEHVTIGAGTITCNHDGTGTSQTVIEHDAYIGSGCNLVAPLRIGAAATIGAGSTITRDVPAAKLTLARARQTTIEDWRGPKKR